MLAHLLLMTSCLSVNGVEDTPYAFYTVKHGPAGTLPATAGQKLTAAELEAVKTGQPVPPFRTLTAGVKLDDGTLWVASTGGLFTRRPDEPRWRLYHSRRWLASNDVRDVSVTKDGAIHALTSAGITILAPESTTLTRKMDQINADIQNHHLREGYVGHINVNKPGDLNSGHTQHDSDNDGLWTAIYVAAEAFRFGVTQDKSAKDNAWKSLQTLIFSEKITGISGFVARSFLPSSLPKPQHGEWHPSADGKWWWKGDTSSDELVGHYFAYSIYYDLAATPEEKETIRKVVARITDHIIDHGYYYVGPPGKPTTWGVWAPEKLNRDIRRVGDRGLNSLEILDFLKVAQHITGDERYHQCATELIDKYGYAANTILQKTIWPPTVNHSDDELGFLSYYPLLWYERNPELRRYYMGSIERSWRIERPEKSPLFDFIYASALQESYWKDPFKRPPEAFVDPKRYDQADCVAWFKEVPPDLFHWTVVNSDRADIGPIKLNRHRHKVTDGLLLPLAERPVMRWNGDPFQLDSGGDGRSRDDGAFILLPYWMGRYHRFLN